MRVPREMSESDNTVKEKIKNEYTGTKLKN